MLRPSSTTIPGPLSRRFDAVSARDGDTPVRVESTVAERQALAADCDLPAIDALDAELAVKPEGVDGLHVTGRVKARIRQVCVVSLDEFTSVVDEPVDVHFVPEPKVAAEVKARAARPAPGEDEETEDLPDPIVGGRIDLGALVAETLVLALDPYPRKPGASFVESLLPAPDEVVSPFAVLRNVTGKGGA